MIKNLNSHQAIEINEVKIKEYYGDSNEEEGEDDDEEASVDESYTKSDNYASNYNNCLKIYKSYSINKEKSKTIFMFGNRILLLPHAIGLYIFILIIIFILSTILRIRILLYLAICPIVFYSLLTTLNCVLFFYNLRILKQNSENFIHETSLEKRILKINLNQISNENSLINENSLNKHVDYIKNRFIGDDTNKNNEENLVIIFYNDYYARNIKMKTLFHLFIHFLINFLGFSLCIILIKIV